MNQKLIEGYHEALELAQRTQTRVEKYNGTIETCDPDDVLKREMIMAKVSDCDARQIVNWYEVRIREWINRQPALVRRALSSYIIEGMTVDEACEKADPKNLNYTKEAVRNLLKSLPEK